MKTSRCSGKAPEAFRLFACLAAAALLVSCVPKRVAPPPPAPAAPHAPPGAPAAPPAPAAPAPAPRGAAPAQPAVPGGAPAAARPAGPPAYYTHTVRYYGESVSIIAAWYTGAIENWKALAEANPGIDPNRIVVGDKLRIPEELMTKREPMPKEFVDSFYPKSSPKPKPPHAPRDEEEPALFGPKR